MGCRLVHVDVLQGCVVRYFAAIRAAAGVSEDTVPAATLAEALSAVRAVHDVRFSEVLRVCSYVVDGDPVGARAHESVAVTAGSVVDCLPPFAGG
jgi:molybdopterin converting factor small subunit